MPWSLFGGSPRGLLGWGLDMIVLASDVHAEAADRRAHAATVQRQAEATARREEEAKAQQASEAAAEWTAGRPPTGRIPAGRP